MTLFTFLKHNSRLPRKHIFLKTHFTFRSVLRSEGLLWSLANSTKYSSEGTQHLPLLRSSLPSARGTQAEELFWTPPCTTEAFTGSCSHAAEGEPDQGKAFIQSAHISPAPTLWTPMDHNHRSSVKKNNVKEMSWT